MSEKFKYTNRLIRQKSPYLLQHAHNPVDWHSWGQEAFDLAREWNRPIFLSIGYATCHWCHVMEKESFENEEIAVLLNETFVNIKVDREELPEVDLLYMEFAQSMMSGSAGWPLNLVLTPDLEPFFATTYLPPFASHGLMGFTELIMRIREIWEGDEREKVVEQAEKIVEAFADNIHIQGEELPEREVIDETKELLLRISDPVYGGMKGAPKFPIGYQTDFLLREAKYSSDSRALFMVERTLDMMHRGGIYDHLGGGFSRYSVDEKWLVPHFEKMLYDNALLAFSYLEAWQATKNSSFQWIAEDVLEYVMREMTHPEGGFYSAQDADTEGKEGYFYTFTYDEIVEVLGEGESQLFCKYYDVTPQGNFEGRNILHTPLSMEEFVLQNQLDLDAFKKTIAFQKQELFQVRSRRVHPFKDDKILSSWNGLMIFAMVEAGRAFNRPRFLESATQAAEFLFENMTSNGTLLRRWREGEASFNGALDEYAFLIRGLISLFEADCGTRWLRWAMDLTATLEKKFKAENGAFFQTDGEDENIILRKCQFSDGAEPSGNAVHTENLLRLYQLTGDKHYLNQAEDCLKAVKSFLESYSPGYCYHVISLLRYYDRKAPTIVISLNETEDYLSELLQWIYTSFIPHKAVIVRRRQDQELFRLLPYVKEQVPIQGETTLYVCLEGVCEAPVHGYEAMEQALKKI